jgi:serine/threonine protein kinase
VTMAMKLIDFGESCFGVEEKSPSVGFAASCRNDEPVGSPTFMAPEMLYRCHLRRWLFPLAANPGLARIAPEEEKAQWWQKIVNQERLWYKAVPKLGKDRGREQYYVCGPPGVDAPTVWLGNTFEEAQRLDYWSLGQIIWSIIYQGLYPREEPLISASSSVFAPLSSASGMDCPMQKRSLADKRACRAPIAAADVWIAAVRKRDGLEHAPPSGDWRETAEFLAGFNYNSLSDPMAFINGRIEQVLHILSRFCSGTVCPITTQPIQFGLTSLLERTPEARTLRSFVVL